MLWRRNNFWSLCNKSYAVSVPTLDLNFFFFFFQRWVSTLLIKETVSLLFGLGLFNNKRAYRNYGGSVVTKQVPPSDGACRLRDEMGSSSLTQLSCPVWLDFHSKFASLSIGSRFPRLPWQKREPVFTSNKKALGSLQGWTSVGFQEPVVSHRISKLEREKSLIMKEQERNRGGPSISPLREENQGHREEWMPLKLPLPLQQKQI